MENKIGALKKPIKHEFILESIELNRKYNEKKANRRRWNRQT